MTTDLFDLRGHVAVVTGGNRGIGRGIGLALAGAGASVAIWSRDTERNAAAAKEIEELGAGALGVECDVADPASIDAALDATLAHFGRVDSGFANAGFGQGVDAMKMDLDDWRGLLGVNLEGAFLSMRAVARHVIERGGGGKLVAISSITEIFGSPMQPHYAASKGALGALVRSLAVRLARYDIQVNAIQPGWILTDATAPAQRSAKLEQVILGRTPARRWGRTEDLAGICVYLASKASAFHTGDTIRVDGGYSVF